MTETPEHQQGGPDEVPSEENLDVEGPNESAQPSGAPGLDDERDAGNGDGDG